MLPTVVKHGQIKWYHHKKFVTQESACFHAKIFSGVDIFLLVQLLGFPTSVATYLEVNQDKHRDTMYIMTE